VPRVRVDRLPIWRFGGVLIQAIAVLLPLICSMQICSAQTPAGRIAGRVFDPSGAVVVGARVEALQIETERGHRTVSNSQGEYRFAVLPVGTYTITAAAPGFNGQPRRLRLEVGRRLRVDLDVLLESTDVAIEVAESTPLLEPENAAVGSVIGREAIANLPLNERQFLQLALLSAGTLQAAQGSELSRQNNSGLHISGARESSNNFLLDGVDNNDLYINRLVVSPPLDSVREFRLHVSNYQAEYGRGGGAQINVVSRAGTNQPHGSFYEYLRNDSLDARNFFDSPEDRIPQFQRNQFGGSIGGPILREKSFFFAGFEGTRIRDGVTKTARVPTPEQRLGDFSGSPVPLIDPFTQQPFPDNRIPADRIHPSGAAIASRWPDPNRAGAGQNFVSSPVGDALVNQIYGRADHYFSPSDAFYMRYNLSHDRSLEPFNDGVTNVPGFGSFVLNRGQNLVVSETHIFGPSTIWEGRFGFNRLRREVVQQNAGTDFAAELGIPGLSTDPRFAGFPGISVGGVDNLSDNTALPILREDNTFHLLQNVTQVRGRHTFKWGGEFRYFGNDGIQGFFPRGQLNFLGAFTQNPVGDLLLGFPTFTIQTVIDNPFKQRTSSWNGYLQDNWRITPRLTLNLGLRYEWNQPATDANDRFTTFDFGSQELVRAGTGGVPRAGFGTDGNNFAPRFGLSWSPRAANDLVLRGGYGIFYDSTILEANSGLYFNPPFFELRLFFPSQERLLTLNDPFPSGAGFSPPPTAFAMHPSFSTPYLQHWNASVEKTLTDQLVARAAYVGSKGTKLLRQRDINQPAPGAGPTFLRQPIPGFANVILFESAASSVYHSAQLSLERRFAAGLAFSAGYTISKSIDDNSAFLSTDGDPSFPQNSHNLRAERGLSTFDQRQRFVFTASYSAPFRKNILVRDWQFHAIVAFQSGTPFTPQLSFDNSNTGNTGAIAGSDRPDVVGDPSGGASTPERFFNTAAFATAAPEMFGNAGRNILTGPGLATVDVAVVRTFRLGESAAVDFRAEAFNLANRPNFDLPIRISDQPGFGSIPSARSARQIQFSLRLRY
jgi:outer membrane receptor protein involved in Fe transport